MRDEGEHQEENGPSVPWYFIAPLCVNPVGVKTSRARRSPESGSLDSTREKNLARRALLDSGKVGAGHCVLSVAIPEDASTRLCRYYRFSNGGQILRF